MAIRHGNKTYLQILLDPNRAQLLMQLAESQKVRPTAWIRDMVYKQLELCVSEAQYKEAFEADKSVWAESIQRRVEGRARLKKEVKDA
ncbi:hypothetical protein [Limnobacter sp.]|uniref:hypothetical protein n=1 Tax=Limnobacter sp. TaxID=2003368 RepID=UPI0025C1611C|nr:hypothetical protein [Limnobacter sp.]